MSDLAADLRFRLSLFVPVLVLSRPPAAHPRPRDEHEAGGYPEITSSARHDLDSWRASSPSLRSAAVRRAFRTSSTGSLPTPLPTSLPSIEPAPDARLGNCCDLRASRTRRRTERTRRIRRIPGVVALGTARRSTLGRPSPRRVVDRRGRCSHGRVRSRLGCRVGARNPRRVCTRDRGCCNRASRVLTKRSHSPNSDPSRGTRAVIACSSAHLYAVQSTTPTLKTSYSAPWRSVWRASCSGKPSKPSNFSQRWPPRVATRRMRPVTGVSPNGLQGVRLPMRLLGGMMLA